MIHGSTTANVWLAAADGEVQGIDLFIPEMYDIVWSAVVLIPIALIFYKIVIPKFTAILDERSAKIEGGINRAEEVQAEADAKLQEYEELLAEARTEAAQIREAARTEGGVIVQEFKTQAQADAERIRETANRQIEAERQQAAVTLRQDVGSLATDLASKIVGESLEDEVRQSRMVDRFLAELETANAEEAAVEGK